MDYGRNPGPPADCSRDNPVAQHFFSTQSTMPCRAWSPAAPCAQTEAKARPRGVRNLTHFQHPLVNGYLPCRIHSVQTRI